VNNPLPDPAYVTSLEELFWGATLIAITMAMHGFGMVSIQRVTGAVKERLVRAPSFLSGMSVLVLASWLILIVHLLEVFAWCGFFYWQDAVKRKRTHRRRRVFAIT
jgi:membrane-bound ClpP family serine protease